MSDTSAYESGGGYRSSPALTPRGFLLALLFVALFLGSHGLLVGYFGNRVAGAVFELLLAACMLLLGLRQLREPKKFEEAGARKEARRARLWAIATLAAGAVMATSSLYHLLLVPE